ncbi:MarR family transcriptional regulator (plasmid) [Bacillus cereus]|uniref:MarR family transcriptional regulator n=1 Tax=Bacillus cereus TaxID=1396 RepID=A0A9X7XN17_BACCE|nr:MarR family transcriptional regulator [Bacillus cereus]QHV08247.1 MarR family transcriptional regulator [Bacillus cereus]QHV08257.1 MarR family transcriptional regulator [Bacillus cereus]QHV47717.1 MarR family transcriptional regulator [Bacillus cereus]QHV47727.1 MarR family transcriptional regulator [Bacillus cereus]QHV47745.1 MarR family transcriptional regulator [Bacillus cereus]
MKKIVDFSEVEKNARVRDLEIERKKHENHYTKEQERALGQALETLESLTGNEYYVGRKRDPFAQVEFSQIIQANVRYLIKIGYLTNAERLLLLDLSCYVEVGTHVLVEKDVDSIDRDVINNASVTYLAEETYRTRHGLSKLMKSLKDKGILACAESGFSDESGRICTKRTWLVNPNIICASRKTSIDRVTKHIFKGILKNFTVDSDSKKIHNLPVYFF